VFIWYILTRFGALQQEKSGNPAAEGCPGGHYRPE
jgi:hypothetical protein